jgi:3'-phosphoadenosine 5'-phosphosulfate sulfotransferase
MMWDWIKDKWELLVSAFVVLTVFVLGRKSKEKQAQVAEAVATAKDKEIEVVKEVTAEEKLRLAKAHSKYVNTRIALRKQQRAAKTELERETLTRKLELVELAKEDPGEIDRILMEEYNIAKLK